jgi:hypothetical protein
MRRSYSFIVTTVRFNGELPCEASGGGAPGAVAGVAGVPAPSPGASEKPSLSARLKAMVKKWFSRQ